MSDHLAPLPAVVALGGGHGLSATLTALRRLTDRVTAVVTVADDGGSSGRLRQELDCLPPGDLRMALAALCSDDREGRLWADVLQSRFEGTGPLAGHAIGNLLIAGLWQRLGDPVEGLDMVAQLLRTRGRVLPMSAVPLTIEADVVGLLPQAPDEGSVVRGQATVAKTPGQVLHVRLDPTRPPAHPASIAAVQAADFVVLGPGSWFTSVIPHLLVPELEEAIITAPGKRVLILNLVPAAETAGFTPSAHLDVLAEHAPRLRLDHIIADERFVAHDRHLQCFSESLGARLHVARLGARDGSARHDPLLLASSLAEVFGV
ncbi:MAG: uridine diphosphate-N-acetylglucosamine-binding protein YvcK [Actinomycetia bacterium]|mgnify:FL=1|nr:uridine diphosphate-N-acetylglucosamine-binding protein YvcK [Actinomycetes bacterium]